MQPNDRALATRATLGAATLLRRGQLAGRLAVGKKELESKQRARYSHSHLSRRDVAETRKLPQSSKATGNEPGFMNTRVNVSLASRQRLTPHFSRLRIVIRSK